MERARADKEWEERWRRRVATNPKEIRRLERERERAAQSVGTPGRDNTTGSSK
jgi:hypothetical protein